MAQEALLTSSLHSLACLACPLSPPVLIHSLHSSLTNYFACPQTFPLRTLYLLFLREQCDSLPCFPRMLPDATLSEASLPPLHLVHSLTSYHSVFFLACTTSRHLYLLRCLFSVSPTGM